jgi:hypothetical protein
MKALILSLSVLVTANLFAADSYTCRTVMQAVNGKLIMAIRKTSDDLKLACMDARDECEDRLNEQRQTYDFAYCKVLIPKSWKQKSKAKKICRAKLTKNGEVVSIFKSAGQKKRGACYKVAQRCNKAKRVLQKGSGQDSGISCKVSGKI